MNSKLLNSLKTVIEKFNYLNNKELFFFSENTQHSNLDNDIKSIANFRNGESNIDKIQYYKDSILTIVCLNCSDKIIRFVNSKYNDNIIILIVPSKFQFDIFVKKIASSYIDTIVWNNSIGYYIIIVNNQQFS